MQKPSEYAFDGIGTKWTISSLLPLSDILSTRVQQLVEDFDKTYSRFRDDSYITMISRSPGTYGFSEAGSRLLDFYYDLYRQTDGLVTPLISRMLEQLGYDSSYSFKQSPVAAIEPWENVMSWEKPNLTTLQSTLLDFGAAGKGLLVDELVALLHADGVESFVVDGSGDMRQSGAIPNYVGLEHPLDNSMVIGAIDVKDSSLCASASNRRRWHGLHHIVNPATQSPENNIIATWVIAPSAMIADGLATALFFVEPEKLQSAYSFQYVRMFHSQRIDSSKNFSGELFV